MKASYFTILLFLILGISNGFSKVLRVNNQIPSDPAQNLFSSLLEAHNFANSGDTLYVEGSPIEYTNVIFTKKLIVIGTGYLLSENPETNANALTSVVRQIRLDSGSEGTFLIGLTFSNSSSGYVPYVEANDVVIMRCYLNASIQFIGDLQNIKVLQNFFQGGNISIGSSGYSFSNVEFTNNVVRSSFSTNPSNERVFSKIENNIFLGTINTKTSAFRNNIIASTTTSITIDSPDIRNNLVLGTQLSGNGNQTYAAAQLFTGSEGTSTDGQYKLKQSSPYLTAGVDGAEPGIFGGSTPYILSGMPPIPSIFEFSADGFGSVQNGLPIKLKAKSNL